MTIDSLPLITKINNLAVKAASYRDDLDGTDKERNEGYIIALKYITGVVIPDLESKASLNKVSSLYSLQQEVKKLRADYEELQRAYMRELGEDPDQFPDS